MVVDVVVLENGGASLFGGDFFQRDPGESTSETSDEMKKNHYFGNKPFPPKPLVTVAYVVDGCFFFHVYPNESTLPGFQRYSA